MAEEKSKSAGVKLSGRLQAICDLVTPGHKAVDVGCDHGFVSIYLIQNKICPAVLAMDVREGPLSMAKGHIREYGLEPYIETRLSDGLQQYREKEAEVLICAGMGGRLMWKILAEAGEKLADFKEMILQPQSELYEFRRALRLEGFETVDEKIVLEDGKYYFPMKVRRSKEAGTDADSDGFDASLEDRFGRILLKRKDPLLQGYLFKELKSREAIQEKLSRDPGNNARIRKSEIEGEIGYLTRALASLRKGEQGSVP